MITATLPRPFGYGRIVRTRGQDHPRSSRSATPPRRRSAITEINSGIYAFDLAPLFDALDAIGTANKQGEYYLPDLIAIYRQQKRVVATLTVQNADEIRGINSRTELAEVTTWCASRRTKS